MRTSKSAFLTSLKYTLAALSAVAAVSLAGGHAYAGEGHRKCNTNTQECLDKMAAKLHKKGWLGIETSKLEGGRYQITAVDTGSPAAAAGLQAGDILLSLNGVKVHAKNKAELKKVKKSLVPGAAANYVVKRQGSKQQVAVTLGHIPDIKVAEWIGQHLLEHHAAERVASID